MELCKWTIDLGALPSFQQNASTPNSNGFYTGASFILLLWLANSVGALAQEVQAGDGETLEAARLVPAQVRVVLSPSMCSRMQYLSRHHRLKLFWRGACQVCLRKNVAVGLY